MKALIHISTLLLLAAFGNPAAAAIQLTTTAETEVTETNSEDAEITKRVPAAEVVPGSEVIYTITAHNTGPEPAGDVVITNPIPEQTVYVEGSAYGAGARITFSVDGGETWDEPEALTVTDQNGNTRPAAPEDYTHIRWVLEFELEPGKKAPVWYRVRVK